LVSFFFLGGVRLPARALLQRLEEAEEAGGFADAAELDAKGLHFNEQVLDVDDFVPDQALQKDANQADEAVLHVLVLDVFATRDAVADVQVDELGRQVHRGRQTVHHFHRVQ
jgi:hypothetical protein